MTEENKNNQTFQEDSQNQQTQQEDNQEDAKNNEPEQVNSDPNLAKISELEVQNKDLNDKLLRTLAELENTRRRTKEELEKTAKFALSNFASELIVAVENFFLANDNAPKEELEKTPSSKSFFEAISMTQKELMKLLEKNQIKRNFPLGEKFDHNLHEAISQVESEKEEGEVVQVVQAGYSIAGRIIRPALVAVSKGNKN
jgi:molecular chaperone GrpE